MADLKQFDMKWLERRGSYYAMISPDQAAELMSRNTNNRRIKNRKIAQYMRDMMSGHWNADASDIKFDRDGVLLDGQNRLLACVEAGVPFPTFVRTGLDPTARDHVDTGAARSIADAFRMHEVADWNNAAAAVALRNRYDIMLREELPLFRSYAFPAMTHQEALDYLAAHPMIEKMGQAGDGMHRVAPRIARSVWRAFASMMGESDEPKAREFATKLITGESTGTGDPLIALTRYLVLAQAPKEAGNRDRNAAMRNLMACLKAWNAWHTGELMQKLTVEDGEQVPAVA